MAKNKKNSNTKAKSVNTKAEETKVEEVAEPVASKAEVKETKEVKASKKEKKQKATKSKVVEPKKSRIKETFAELKKVSWPSFAKTMKQTGMVLSIVLIFGIVVFGFDVLISYLLKLVSLI